MSRRGRSPAHRFAGAALLAVALAAPGLVVAGAAEQQRAQYVRLHAEAQQLEEDIAFFRSKLLDRYECPPATPNKVRPRELLDDMAARRARAAIEHRALDNARILAGRAGEGQLADGVRRGADEWRLEREGLLLSDEEMAALGQMLADLASALPAARNDLEGRPRTEAECQPSLDPVASVSFAAPSAEPGREVSATVTAVTASGKALQIDKVDARGLEAIGTLLRVQGLPSTRPTVVFRIADVRRQGPFPVNVRVTGTPAGAPPGAPSASGNVRTSYTVLNVPPRIMGMPAAPESDPGDTLTFSGTVDIVDRNADADNPFEIRRAALTFSGHPPALSTLPGGAFRRLQRVRSVRHDPDTGRYRFEIAHDAVAAWPHAHGVFPTRLRVTDSRGAGADREVAILVRNVAPEGVLRVRPKKHFHGNDEIPVELIGTLSDGNGREDIESLTVDARAAGGPDDLYESRDGGVALTPAGEAALDFTLDPARFRHTDRGGEYVIDSVARDGGGPRREPALEGTFSAVITVGNEAPSMTAVGYLYGGTGGERIRVCPRQRFPAATAAIDAEGDALHVTATVQPGGQPQKMRIRPGASTWTAVLPAPPEPGEYTVVFRAVEHGVDDPKQATRSVPLTVERCETVAAQGPAACAARIEAAPGSIVKLAPPPPALPGEPPEALDEIGKLAVLLHWARALDKAGEAFGLPPSEDPAAATILGDWLSERNRPFCEKGPVQVLEEPAASCKYGDGTGPVVDLREAPEESPGTPDDEPAGDDDPDVESFDELQRRLEAHWAELEAIPEDYDLPEWEEWPDAGGTPDAASQAAALRDRYAALDERQRTYDRIREGYEEQLARAQSAGDDADVARIRRILDDVDRTQGAIESESAAAAAELAQLEESGLETLELRASVSAEINHLAYEELRSRLAIDEALQDVKSVITTGTRWVSTGSEMQQQTDRTTRMADRELAAADAKLEVIDALLADAEPGSPRTAILEQKRTLYEGQRDAAIALLDSNATLTAIGYGFDVVTTIGGVKLVQLGKRLVIAGARRAFAQQTAERVIATTTEKGIIEVAKTATGRGAAAAASGAAPGAAGSGAAAAGRAASGEAALSEAAQAALDASRTQLYDEAIEVSEQAIDDFVEGSTDPALREAAAEVIRRAETRHGGNLGAALDEVMDEILGTDFLAPNTAEARAVGEAIDAAGRTGREAFNSPAGRAAAEGAPAARAAAARAKAQEIMEQRYGQQAGRQLLDEARHSWRAGEDGLDAALSGSDFYGYAPLPFLLGYTLQEGADEGPVQGVIPEGGVIRLSGDRTYEVGTTETPFIRLRGGGPRTGRVVAGTTALPDEVLPYAGEPLTIGTDYTYVPLLYPPVAPLGVDEWLGGLDDANVWHDGCRIKKSLGQSARSRGDAR